MRKRTASLAAALALLTGGWLSPAQAEVPAPGSREGELLCAGWTNVLASGTLLTTGGDALTAVRAHGVFLGRLSVIAPDARYRLQDYLAAYDKLTPAEQAKLGDNCIATLRQVEAIRAGASDAKVW
jgi:hypothetical protein